jgi:hypothetical protein
MKVLGIEVTPQGLKIGERDIDIDKLREKAKERGDDTRALDAILGAIASVDELSEVAAVSTLSAVVGEATQAFDALGAVAGLVAHDPETLDSLDYERIRSAQRGLLAVAFDLLLAYAPEDAEQNDSQRKALNSLARIRRGFEQEEWAQQRWIPDDDDIASA